MAASEQERAQIAEWVQQECARRAPKYGVCGCEVIGYVFERLLRRVNKLERVESLERYIRRSCRYEIGHACREEREAEEQLAFDFQARSASDDPVVDEAIRREQASIVTEARAVLSAEEQETLDVSMQAGNKDGAIQQLALRRGWDRLAIYRQRDRALTLLRERVGVKLEH